MDLLLGRLSRPCQRCGLANELVHVHDVFGPFWQPFCQRLQQLEEKLLHSKRQAQRRQVELAQTAQDTAEALKKAQQPLLSPAASHDRLRELKCRLEESELERMRLEERLRATKVPSACP